MTIDLPQPRTVETREEQRYFDLVIEVREALRRSEGDAASDVAGPPTSGAERVGTAGRA